VITGGAPALLEGSQVVSQTWIAERAAQMILKFIAAGRSSEQLLAFFGSRFRRASPRQLRSADDAIPYRERTR
jgi:hypothetical protein